MSEFAFNQCYVAVVLVFALIGSSTKFRVDLSARGQAVATAAAVVARKISKLHFGSITSVAKPIATATDSNMATKSTKTPNNISAFI